jgi:predicted nucleic acid-binding protein
VLDAADAHHRQAALALREHGRSPFLMPASAYSEALVRPLKRGLDDAVEEFVETLHVSIVAADRRIGRRAAELRAKHGTLRLPDALVLATAQACEAQLLTFDARLARFAGEGAQS